LGNFFLPLVSLPFQFLFGLAGGFNATFILMMSATGVATYALCRRFVASRPACLLGGLAVVVLPYSWVEVYNGVPRSRSSSGSPLPAGARSLPAPSLSGARRPAGPRAFFRGHVFLVLRPVPDARRPVGFLVRGLAARKERAALRSLAVALLVTVAVHGSLVLRSPFGCGRRRG